MVQDSQGSFVGAKGPWVAPTGPDGNIPIGAETSLRSKVTEVLIQRPPKRMGVLNDNYNRLRLNTAVMAQHSCDGSFS